MLEVECLGYTGVLRWWQVHVRGLGVQVGGGWVKWTDEEGKE